MKTNYPTMDRPYRGGVALLDNLTLDVRNYDERPEDNGGETLEYQEHEGRGHNLWCLFDSYGDKRSNGYLHI